MHYRSGLRILVLVTSLAAMLTGCDSRRVYEDNREFASRQWLITEEPSFDFVITDSTREYNLYYNLRNSLHYGWDRIYITYVLTDSSGQELSRKLLYNELFDPAGRPYGESGIGDIYDHRFPILTGYRFAHPGKYSIRLTQFSRQDTLQGILAVGVRVEERDSPEK